MLNMVKLAYMNFSDLLRDNQRNKRRWRIASRSEIAHQFGRQQLWRREHDDDNECNNNDEEQCFFAVGSRGLAYSVQESQSRGGIVERDVDKRRLHRRRGGRRASGRHHVHQVRKVVQRHFPLGRSHGGDAPPQAGTVSMRSLHEKLRLETKST